MSIYGNIEEYLASKKIKPAVKSAESLEWYMPLGNRSRIYCDLKKETFGWVINMCFPVTADCSVPEEMLKVAEFVTRANLVISSGCFQLDWKTGEVKFRYHFTISEDMVTYENIKNLLEYISGVVYTYENSFFSTLFSNNDVESHVVSCIPPCYPELVEPKYVAPVPEWALEDSNEESCDDDTDDDTYEEDDEEFYDDDEEFYDDNYEEFYDNYEEFYDDDNETS
ncbi:MAG: YbjN domain-containing protein [Ruminococcus sp.]|nr:YbjN domain-containing protein [Ruminococcus sp.]